MPARSQAAAAEAPVRMFLRPDARTAAEAVNSDVFIDKLIKEYYYFENRG